jgi:hypothetical protein
MVSERRSPIKSAIYMGRNATWPRRYNRPPAIMAAEPSKYDPKKRRPYFDASTNWSM